MEVTHALTILRIIKFCDLVHVGLLEEFQQLVIHPFSQVAFAGQLIADVGIYVTVVGEVGCLSLSDLCVCLRTDFQFAADLSVGASCQRRKVADECAQGTGEVV